MSEFGCMKQKVREELKRGQIGPNTECPYHPSHHRNQDCSFCFCPFFPCKDPDLGDPIVLKNGLDAWNCSRCLFIHKKEVVSFIFSEVSRLGIDDACDPRFKDIFRDAKERFYKKGKAIMVIGATSDAGKSITVTALCKIISDMGFSVAPFKSQNMSLNSVVTRDGSEVAMIQALQSKAAGITNPESRMNPILLKPKGDTISQVMVNGKPFGDYDVKGYYSDFIPNHGMEIMKKNIDSLLYDYDYVIMEGAGSPAEINIYDTDIANMRAAEAADADCILVVNVEWGGSFAYVVGTVELLPEQDRRRIKGIIFNNLRGKANGLKEGTKIIENLLGIPVLGIVPHIDFRLPMEDSEYFRTLDSEGKGKTVVSVIKLPRIANFTDVDPLHLEDVTVKFVERPADLFGTNAIIIPGTKNTIDDLAWMRRTGMDKTILALKGKVPILGICGGYQMMGKKLIDKSGIEGGRPSEVDGLGLLDLSSEWNGYSKRVVQDHGVLIETDEPIDGYEIHMGMSDVHEEPLFRFKNLHDEWTEGSSRPNEKLFGTYLHGLFDRPGFRRYYLSFAGASDSTCAVDYDDDIEKNIAMLAKAYLKAMDKKKLGKLIRGVSQ